MSCVIGFESNGVIYMGADSAGIDSSSLSISTRVDEKVFVAETNDFIMGFAGSFRVGQLLRYASDLPEQSNKKDDMAYMVTDFVDSIKNAQRDHGALRRDSEIEEHDAEFLVGYKGKLYIIESDFQVCRPIENYAAIGSGAQVALGALYALRDSSISPQNKIQLALNAASEYCAGVRPPFVILKL